MDVALAMPGADFAGYEPADRSMGDLMDEPLPTASDQPVQTPARKSRALTGCFVGCLFVAALIAGGGGLLFYRVAEDRKAERTMMSMRTLSRALEAFATDHNFYPPSASDAALRTTLKSYLHDSDPMVDEWNRPLRYECWKTTTALPPCEAYAIGSAGPDGTFEKKNLVEYTERTTGDDMVLRDGEFVVLPAKRWR